MSEGVHIETSIGMVANGTIVGENVPAPLICIHMDPDSADEVIALRIESFDPHEVLVDVMHDGTVRYGPNYDPDEAARIFWLSMATSLPHWINFVPCPNIQA